MRYKAITDFVTGRPVLDVGAEANRQAVEKYLVDKKGYHRNDIAVDMPVSLEVSGEPYHTTLDLVVFVGSRAFMVIKCVAGSLGSREREVVYAARVARAPVIIPVAVASDGYSALVFDAADRKRMGEGMEAMPSPESAREIIAQTRDVPRSANRLEKEKIIFRSYDIQNVDHAGDGCSGAG